jgi:hypothetical protein
VEEPAFRSTFLNPGGAITGGNLRQRMGRAQERARGREKTKRERSSEVSARDSAEKTLRRTAGEGLETPNETARRIFRTGGKSKRREKTGRAVGERRLKWREGRQS